MDPVSAVAVVTQVCNQSLLNATDRQTCDVALQVLASIAGAPAMPMGGAPLGANPKSGLTNAETDAQSGTEATPPEAGQASEAQTPVGDGDILNA